MPWMTQKQENELNKPWKCEVCKQNVNRHYCRECDEFYFECGCEKKTGHENCEGFVQDRSYRH